MVRSIQVHRDKLLRVKQSLERCGFPTQGALATHLSISLSTVNNFLNGKKVYISTFEEISRVLGFNPSCLTGADSVCSHSTTDDNQEYVLGIKEIQEYTVFVSIKLKGRFATLTHKTVSRITGKMRELLRDPTIRLVEASEGCIRLLFQLSTEGLQRLQDLHQIKAIESLVGYPVLEIREDSNLELSRFSGNRLWNHISQWVQSNNFVDLVSDLWNSETFLVGTFYMISTQISVNDFRLKSTQGSFRDADIGAVKDFVDILRSENEEFAVRISAAARLGSEESKTIGADTSEVTGLLAKWLSAQENLSKDKQDQQKILEWQAALSLGRWSPGHPKSALAKRRIIDSDQPIAMELLVAEKVRDDGDIDIFFQLYSLDYLPSHSKMSILDEFGDVLILDEEKTIYLEAESGDEDYEIHIGFSSFPGFIFSLNISLGEERVFIGSFVVHENLN